MALGQVRVTRPQDGATVTITLTEDFIWETDDPNAAAILNDLFMPVEASYLKPGFFELSEVADFFNGILDYFWKPDEELIEQDDVVF